MGGVFIESTPAERLPRVSGLEEDPALGGDAPEAPEARSGLFFRKLQTGAIRRARDFRILEKPTRARLIAMETHGGTRCRFPG
jgi:hypothetical protein